MTNKNRIEFIEIMKGIAIFLMVVGHTDSPFDVFIYLFHMPVFFFISGYLYKDIYSTHIALLFKKRLKSLYLPFVTAELIFMFLHNFFYKVGIINSLTGSHGEVSNPYNWLNYVKKFINILAIGNTEQLLIPLWFIISLFTVNFLFAFVSKISLKFSSFRQETIRAILVFSFFIFGLLLTKFEIDTLRYFDTSLVAVSIFYLGYLFNKHESNVPMNPVLGFFCLLLLALNSFYGEVVMITNRYDSPAFLIFCVLAGVYFTTFLAKFIDKKSKKIKDFFVYIGSKSLYILILHYLCFKLVALIQIQVEHLPDYYLAKVPTIANNGFWWIPYTFVGILFPLAFAALWEKATPSIYASSSYKLLSTKSDELFNKIFSIKNIR